MVNRESIKTFVRQTLGCGCPEEVFNYIDCQSDVVLKDILLSRKINIGNRLLIYVIEVSTPDSVKHILPLLVETGRRERESMRFNRFRLVLAADSLNEIKQAADAVFETVKKDERVHLHIIPKADIPIF